MKLLKEAANKYGEIETLGPIAHNQQLVEELTKVGVKPVNHLDQVQGKILAISTHGTSPALLSEIEARQIHIIDATCPVVHKAQNVAKELAEADFDVIVFGEAEHPEVKGLLGWAREKGVATLDAGQILNYKVVKESEKRRASPHYPLLGRGRLGIISQTTQSKSAFIEFVRQLIVASGLKAKEVRIVNTLCQAVQKRQEAALRLAHKSQLMIVIGGYNSANSRHLAETCSHIVETRLIEGTDELDDSWLEGKHHIGITAGTSTPDETIEAIIVRLESLKMASVGRK
jgi:4-hydroxy-3-methylbut-2-enyl diphosphate reductase